MREIVVAARNELPYGLRSFEMLAGQLYRPLRRLAFSILGDADEGDSVTQDVLLRIMHGLPKLEDVTLFQPWLTRITINVCRSYMARERREREKRNASHELVDTPEPLKESDFEFTKMIEGLSLNERTIVAMRILSDMEFAVIGEIVDMKLSAVKMTYYRALGKVKSRLGETTIQ